MYASPLFMVVLWPLAYCYSGYLNFYRPGARQLKVRCLFPHLFISLFYPSIMPPCISLSHTLSNIFFSNIPSPPSHVSSSHMLLLLHQQTHLLYSHSHISHYINYINIQRLEASLRSPVINHFSECLSGAVTLRAFGSIEQVEKKAFDLINNSTRASLIQKVC